MGVARLRAAAGGAAVLSAARRLPGARRDRGAEPYILQDSTWKDSNYERSIQIWASCDTCFCRLATAPAWKLLQPMLPPKRARRMEGSGFNPGPSTLMSVFDLPPRDGIAVQARWRDHFLALGPDDRVCQRPSGGAWAADNG